MDAPPHIFRQNDEVMIGREGIHVIGHVTLASSNGLSLMLCFQAMLGGYVGMMPVLFEGGEFRDLIEGKPVTLRPWKPQPGA